MSNYTKKNVSNDDTESDLLEKLIFENYINCYDCNEFKNNQLIGNSSFTNVFRANWKNTHSIFVLKSFFNNDEVTLKKIIKEIKLHLTVGIHENIIRFCGVTKSEFDKYTLVFEYADSGSLEVYLYEHFSRLDWYDKYQLALQLANAVAHIHECDIIHCNLHANDILVHQKNIKLAGFNLSRKISELSDTSKTFGIIPYVDPKVLDNKNHQLNKKSDVYSIGVLLWQISSGYKPFKYEDYYDLKLTTSILDGLREKIIDDTPIKYSTLYSECWKYEPDQRPDMQDVVLILKDMIFSDSTRSVNKRENMPLEKSNSTPIEVNSGISNVEFKRNSKIETDIKDGINNTDKKSADQEYSSAQFQYFYNKVIGTEINKSKAFELYKIAAENGNNNAQYNLSLLYQLGEGVDKDEIKAFELMKDLADKEYLKGQFQLGYYYSSGIGTEVNKLKAFELFKTAANKGHKVAQYNLGIFYQSGTYTERDEVKAFEYYRKSADQEYLDAQFQLGCCYDKAIGTEINKSKAFKLYKIAARKGNNNAQYNLSLLYELGEGVDKNEKKAFKLIKNLAKKECLNAQFKLGYYYDLGIGTEINKPKAFKLYKIAAEKGNDNAQYNLSLLYQLGKGVYKNEKKAFELMKDLAEKEYLNAQFKLGYYYDEGIGTEINKSKAFEFYKIAAEKGSNKAQYNLGLLYELGEGVDKDEKRAFEIMKDLAEKEYLNAQFKIGYYYYEGIGTEINKSKAFEFYKIAAEKGSNKAQYNLGSLYELGEGVDKYEKRAFEIMKDLAEKECLNAQCQLGYYYNEGIGTKINKSKAFELYKIAAEKGSNKAQYNLGSLYELGEGVDKDEKRAFEIMKDLAEKEYLNAQFKIGYYYYEGIGTEINKSKAFELYKIVAEKGSNTAQYNLGLLYELGEGVDKDEKRAFEIMKDLAEKEYLIAQFKLGCYYDEGIGTEINKSKAFEFYKIAAEKGSNKAQYNLGSLYELGGGVDKDEKKAFEIMKDLAEKEYLKAQCQLGYYYNEGIGTEINKSKAFELYKIAAEKGSNKAQYNLGSLYELGEGVDKDEKKAFEMMKDLAENEYLNAQFKLGYYYSNGIGTEINKSKAFELYKIAAEKGSNKAQYNLGSLYELGEGVDKDEKKAFEIMKNLAENEYLDGQFQIGYYYSNGIGTEINKSKAFELYRIAAEKDHKIAQNNLKLLNERCQEVYEELEKAFYWFDKAENNKDKLIEVENSIFWSNALEIRLCELYMKDDVMDIFWGQPIEEHLAGSITWNIYVIIRGLHHSYTKTEIIADNQIIHFIAEEAGFVGSFDDPLPSSVKIPQDLKESFDKALDNELGLSFREKHYNLVGMSTGYKRTKGQLTEIPAIILYVRQKGILRRGCDIFPKKICEFPVDVIEACIATPCTCLSVNTCRLYQKHVKLGSSIGIGLKKSRNTTGTLSAVVYENKLPKRVGIISCEHVLKFSESASRKNITVYQPSHEDLFEPERELKNLRGFSEEYNEYENEIIEMQRKLEIAESQDSTLATYIRGTRENFLSEVDNKKYGIDAGFCVFVNKDRTLCPKKFSIPSNYFTNARISICLEGTYSYNELKNFDYNTRVFKVGRTTGLTFGKLLPIDQAVACNLTSESIKNAKKLSMEKNIPPYSNEDQGIFIGYMKSKLDSEIHQKRKKCYPVKWFDRQLAFKFESGEFEHGDSGASIIDEKGKALGILHAKWITPYQTYGIASPYFAILEALDVNIYLSPDSIAPMIISSSPSSSSSSSSPASSSSSLFNRFKKLVKKT